MFYFGVDYYPEQWPEERWAVDARLMQSAGFNLVRLADFAWAKLEAQEGNFDFSWLDRVIDLLAQRGMQVLLSTPTASPPAWLMNGHPELFRMDENGQRATFGNRREYCPTQPRYHTATRRLVQQMASHYAHHPAVIGWQIDNEFGESCYCPTCRQAFQAWLQRHYSSLDELNARWGTIFWSPVYSAWEQIPVPLKTGGSPNPGLALDFARYTTQTYVDYQRVQTEIIRESCPGQLVTHNCMGFDYDHLDYHALVRDLDIVSLNHYPRDQWKFASELQSSRVAIQYDAMRGLKQKNFWVTEQQIGQGGWEMISMAPRPGEARLWAYQAIAHGADAILFFRWRTARYGTEQFWQGLLDHDARPTRRFTEIQGMGAELKRIGERIQGSRVRADVALLLSYDSRFAFKIQPNHSGFSYSAHFQQLYTAFHETHVPVDIIEPEADLSDYRLVVAPSLFVVTKTAADNLRHYVEGGGVLFLTQRSGVKDEYNALVEAPFPGLLADLAGIQVEEIDSMPDGMTNHLEFCVPELGGKQPGVGILCEVLAPGGARVVARYAQDYYAGKPAVTHNSYGRGQVVYAGAVGGQDLYLPLASWLLSLARIQPLLQAPSGVEITVRWNGEARIVFFLNHTFQPQPVYLDQPYKDLLQGINLPAGEFKLPALGVAILTQLSS